MNAEDRLADLERRVALLEKRPPGGGGASVLLKDMKRTLTNLEEQVRLLRLKIREVELSPARWNRHDGIEVRPVDDDRDEDGELQPG